MLRYLHLCLSMQQRRWWTMSASNLLIFFFVLFWLEAIYVFFSWKSLLSYTLIKFLLFGAVHKWRQQFFEMFYPSLSLSLVTNFTNRLMEWSNVTFCQIPLFPPKWVTSFMDGPLSTSCQAKTKRIAWWWMINWKWLF